MLAFINSSTLNWYYSNSFSNNSQLTVNISKTFLEQLPIPDTSIEQQQLIKNIVNKILHIKKVDINNDTSDLEMQINTLIYKIYGLTAEEIKMIERK
jgi:hypothetical protein